jgi:hypothetical protein
MRQVDCDTICDEIAHGNIPLDDAMRVYRIALDEDPTESNHAAHIRDAIRDNFEDADI